MRVISQDGRLDFPYERSIVFLSPKDATIVQIQAIGEDEAGTLAKYSTEEKAKKTMEMLREEYGKYVSATGANSYFAFVHPKVFQFPAEEELE